ncbi:MAG TPA: hypothetical protein V6D06_20990 [Trichocoleus sp.]
MRRLTAITLASLASLSLSSCNSFNALFNRGDDSAQVEPTTMPLPDEPSGQVEEEFTEPMVPAAPSAAAIASAELIQSTDPNERIQQINRSRPDPYATVPVPPAPRPVPRPASQPQGQPTGGGTATASAGPNRGGGTASPGGGGAAAPGRGTGSAGGATGSASGAAGRPGSPAGGATGSAGGSPIQPLPSLPQPQLASAVEVTGVVQVGGETYAIVRAPNEPTSRYVRVGQRVANGRVLVKRIQMRGGEEPVVILEENGIEVARAVGSPAEGTAETPTASAGTPTQTVSIPPLPQS